LFGPVAFKENHLQIQNKIFQDGASFILFRD